MSTDNPYYAPPNLESNLDSNNGYLTIRRVDPASTAKMLAALYALMGLILGVFFSLAALLGQANNNNPGGAGSALFGIAAVVVLPIFYGLLGAIGGLIVAFMYNVVASATGGIRIQLSH